MSPETAALALVPARPVVASTPRPASHLRGLGDVYLRGRTWWVRYWVNGKCYRESAKSERRIDAERKLKARLKSQGTGARFVGPKEERVTVDALLDAVLVDHEVNGRRAISTLKGRLSTLRAALGSRRAVDVRAVDVEHYKAERLAGLSARGKAPSVATINRELATLRRAFRLGIQQERLASAPSIKLLAGERIKEGFVEPGTFSEIAGFLPSHLSAPVRFAYVTGWRKQEVLGLTWDTVDLANGLVRLARTDDKTGQPRTLVLTGPLLALVEAQAAERNGSRWVFHHKGQRIGDFRKRWNRACRAAGATGLTLPDLRRSATRNMDKAGVSPVTAMKITGHKTDSMYRRYRIVDEADLKLAIERVQAATALAPSAATVRASQYQTEGA